MSVKTPTTMDEATTTRIARECDEVIAFLAGPLNQVIQGRTALGVAMALARLGAELTFHLDSASVEDFEKVAGAAMQRVHDIHKERLSRLPEGKGEESG